MHVKSVVIVGPGKHFGKSIAKRFGAEGYHIVLVARTEDTLMRYANELRDEGFSCSFVVADVINAADFARILQNHLAETPPVEVLIYNIKVSIAADGLHLSPVDLMTALQANVVGALAVVQSIVPLLSHGGSIIFTGGGYKDTPDPQKVALSVSKGALHTLFLALREVLASKSIKLSTVVIDGVVREVGPLYPDSVAHAFWEASEASEGREFRVSEE
jgi:short-subunit dehydrogenase